MTENIRKIFCNTEDLRMIEKLTVRRMLASYEKKLKDEIHKIENEIQEMNEACISNEMLGI